MDTVGHRAPTKQIRDVYNFNVSNVLKFSPSTRCITAANNTARLEVLNKHNISLGDTFFFA
jgi:hypothetical protein